MTHINYTGDTIFVAICNNCYIFHKKMSQSKIVWLTQVLNNSKHIYRNYKTIHNKRDT